MADQQQAHSEADCMFLQRDSIFSVFRLCICSIKHRSLMLIPVCTSMVTTGPQ